MKVDLISKNGKRLQLHGAEIAVKPNGYDPLLLRAEIDEGDSPVEIVINNGWKHQTSFPIRRLTVTTKERVLVREHTRKYKSGAVTVREHWMQKRMPSPKKLSEKPK